MKADILKRNPEKIDIGAIYSYPCEDRMAVANGAFVPTVLPRPHPASGIILRKDEARHHLATQSRSSRCKDKDRPAPSHMTAPLQTSPQPGARVRHRYRSQ